MPLADCTDQASPANPIIADQRGFPRPDRGNPSCDIGAFEYQHTASIGFSQFRVGLTVEPGANSFYFNGSFTLGGGGTTIDPSSQLVALGVGSYAVRLPVGAFVQLGTGYVFTAVGERSSSAHDHPAYQYPGAV
jgi:hypothetical protein